jgi:peptidoglycan L-alanyl-D-glutamate endopeptidase CwlK
MYELDSDKENIIVTHTKNSRHFPNKDGKATAFDIAIIKNGNKPTWETKWDGNKDGISDYREAALIGQAAGLDAGGLWESWQDWPHYQLRG